MDELEANCTTLHSLYGRQHSRTGAGYSAQTDSNTLPLQWLLEGLAYDPLANHLFLSDYLTPKAYKK